MNNYLKNLQGGNNKICNRFYQTVLSDIPNTVSILNLGCGSRFIFENELIKKGVRSIWSSDIVSTEKPDFVENFFIQSVEEEFHLKKKFEIITFFELIEHVDKTDILLKNCFNNLKENGLLIFSFPNLSSVYSRIELLLGYQPHILEVSNVMANFGTGYFGKINNPNGIPIHHIRGITTKAMIEMISYYGFKTEKVIGYDHRFRGVFYYIPSLAPINFFICRKK
ncbi:MAG: methyltransferase domain-containing protein [bacterium]